jgi:hypothetical protein
MIEFDWSVGRTALMNVVATIPPRLFVDAYELRESGRKLLASTNKDKFIVSSQSSALLDKSEMKMCSLIVNSSDFDSFEDYETVRFQVSACFSWIVICVSRFTM